MGIDLDGEGWKYEKPIPSRDPALNGHFLSGYYVGDKGKIVKSRTKDIQDRSSKGVRYWLDRGTAYNPTFDTWLLDQLNQSFDNPQDDTDSDWVELTCRRCGRGYYIRRDKVASDNGLCRSCDNRE